MASAPPRPAGPHCGTTSELHLLTVNLWGLPWPVARERRVRKRRLGEHLACAEYDLVGIQELWWPWRRTPTLGPLALPRSRRDCGLALAGRLPLRGGVRVEHFGHHRGADRLKRKGLLRARAATPAGAELSVCVVHLQAQRRHAALRARQLEAVLRSLAGEGRPVVLMGDFNFYGDSADDRRSAERLASAGFVDTALALARDEPTYCSSNPYVRGRRRAERFDRVYLRDAAGLRLRPREVEVVRARPRPFSDHHPLRVRVQLSG